MCLKELDKSLKAELAVLWVVVGSSLVGEGVASTFVHMELVLTLQLLLQLLLRLRIREPHHLNIAGVHNSHKLDGQILS